MIENIEVIGQVVTSDNIHLILNADGKVHSLNFIKGQTNFEKARELYKSKDFEGLIEIYNQPLPKELQDFVFDEDELAFQIDGEWIQLPEKARPIFMELLQNDDKEIALKTWATFLKNLNQNCSYRVLNELVDFLVSAINYGGAFPLTEDGCFIGYKAIREDWKDIYSGTIDNSIGTKVVMPRNKVDDNRENGCSYGLHVGTERYANNYGNHTSRIVGVKVNPANVVSVPKDYDFQKMRCTEYEVLFEIPRNTAMQEKVLNPDLYNDFYTGTSYDSMFEADFDEEYLDTEEDFDGFDLDDDIIYDDDDDDDEDKYYEDDDEW